jgi:hypothetical protein
MAIDTLEYVKRLEAAGVDRRQAEAHAQAVRDTLAPQLVTKADLDAAVARLEAKIGGEVTRLDHKIDAAVTRLDHKIDAAVARLDHKIDTAVARLETKMAELEARMLRYMVGQTLAIGGIVFALLRLLK